MLTLLAFLVTIGVLVTVHEYGHYRMAVACGVKVLRFSVGIGTPLLRWRRPGRETEFVLATLPLGGYVLMLDGRKEPVPPEDAHRAFNLQPLRRRVAIILAGPLANLALAVLFFAVVNWWGMQVALPVLATPEPASLAQQAGLQQGDRVLQARILSDGDAGRDHSVDSFEALNGLLMRAVTQGRDVQLRVRGPNQAERVVRLPLTQVERDWNAQVQRRVGVALLAAPVLGAVMEGSAAQHAGLRTGDVVLSVNGVPMRDTVQLRAVIEAYAMQPQDPQRWVVRRPVQGQAHTWQEVSLDVSPQLRPQGAVQVGVIGAMLGGDASTVERVRVRYGLYEGAVRAVQQTWDMGVMTLRMLGRMLLGQASLDNLSGPISIAQYAGQSASMGAVQFVYFLAVVSLSLGVLNLLPLPMLDGGHLMYYLWEAVAGKPVPQHWEQRLQAFGVAALLMLMALALFNDVGRWLG